MVQAFQEHHAYAGNSVGCCGAERHGVGIIKFRCFGFLHPEIEEGDWIEIGRNAGVLHDDFHVASSLQSDAEPVSLSTLKLRAAHNEGREEVECFGGVGGRELGDLFVDEVVGLSGDISSDQ